MPDGNFTRVTPELSGQQAETRDAIMEWRRQRKRQVLHLGGGAGTGKTELAVRVGRELDAQFASFTGKAASVLRQRGADNAVTLHSLLYRPPQIAHGDPIWKRRSRFEFDLVVADECSQIDQRLGRDLLATGAMVLVTGDPGQLPPVSGEPFFGGTPDLTLTEIHRQAAGSQPLQLATAIRGGARVRPLPFNLDAVVQADIAICAFNRTRRNLNRMIRQARGIKGRDPVVGDRIVGLRNNAASGVYNGSLWTVAAIERDRKNDLIWHMRVVDDVGTEAEVRAHDDGFFCAKVDQYCQEYNGLDLFTYGYALTAHKSQGSEWPRVAVIDETACPAFALIAGDTPLGEFRRRWLYTAVTRARSSVTVMRVPR